MPSGDVSEFGGWPRPPRWVRAVAGVAAVAVLAGVVVARTGPHHAAVSSPSRSPAAAASPVPGSRTPAGSAARWPSAAGACGTPVDLPQIHLARRHAHVHARVLVGGTGLRRVTLGGAVSGPLPGLPEHGWLVTSLVAGTGAAYAFDTPCFSSTASVRVYRIVAGAVQRLRITADALLGGPHRAWAVTYRAHHTVLTPLAGGRAVTFTSNIAPVADTAAGLVVAAYHPPAGRRHTVELLDPNTGAVLRRLGGGSPLGAAGQVLLVSAHGGRPTTAAPAGPLAATDSRRMIGDRALSLEMGSVSDAPPGRVADSLHCAVARRCPAALSPGGMTCSRARMPGLARSAAPSQPR